MLATSTEAEEDTPFPSRTAEETYKCIRYTYLHVYIDSKGFNAAGFHPLYHSEPGTTTNITDEGLLSCINVLNWGQRYRLFEHYLFVFTALEKYIAK